MREFTVFFLVLLVVFGFYGMFFWVGGHGYGYPGYRGWGYGPSFMYFGGPRFMYGYGGGFYYGGGYGFGRVHHYHHYRSYARSGGRYGSSVRRASYSRGGRSGGRSGGFFRGK